jgi:hypothetical protein
MVIIVCTAVTRSSFQALTDHVLGHYEGVRFAIVCRIQELER